MKVSLNWLRELVELPSSVEALVDLLTLAGVEVEGIETRGVSIAEVVVAEIRESVQHPNADRLSVCQVDDGSGALRQIVCGAKNFKVGDKVPAALPGAVLPGDFRIKVGKLRGVESRGMLCSAEELGLPKGEDGLLILSPEAVPGIPLSALYSGDTILDLEITPNRPDLLSVNGIAREIGALTARPVRLVEPSEAAVVPAQSTLAIEAAGRCPFYSARVIRGVRVGPSPEWLRTKLESVGLRSINNIVDITNLVMLEQGQPLHAFDLAKVQGGVRVRLAGAGETLAALDGKTYALSPEHLVIADEARGLAIAGIMGGAESAVTPDTTDILLESAAFESAGIRRTSRQLGLSSDSSYRFERGVDRAGVPSASQRACELVVELAGGTPEALQIGGEPVQGATPVVPLRLKRVEDLLGVSAPSSRVEQILTGFGLHPSQGGWSIPTFRADLTREVDLIEEIARVTGMEAIPARTQARFSPASAVDHSYDRSMALRRRCAGLGLHEARSLTLVPEKPLGMAFTQVAESDQQRVKNPMIDDQVVMRPNLLHGLLKAVKENGRAGVKSVRLFEVGRVFSKRMTEEFLHWAMVLCGPVTERSWRTAQGADADLFTLKGLVSAALGGGVTFEPQENPALALALTIKVSGKAVGHAGQLWPADGRALDTPAPIVFAEVDLGAWEKAANEGVSKRFQEIPRFPAVTRDMALVAPLELAHARVEEVLKEAKEPLLVGVELFDVFTDPSGAKLPGDRKSLAYSLTYRTSDRTLTTEEVNAAHARLKDRLVGQLGAVFRE